MKLNGKNYEIWSECEIRNKIYRFISKNFT